MYKQDTFWLLWRLIAITVHVVAFTLDIFVVVRSIVTPDEKERAKLIPWKFLTFWCLVTQTLTFALCLMCDFFAANYCLTPEISEPFNDSTSTGGRSKSKMIVCKLIAIRDHLVFCLAYPLAIFVSTMFWGLFKYNPDLVVPPNYFEKVPPFINHVQHTLIAVFIIFELLVCYHKSPTVKSRFVSLCTFMSAYGIWMLVLGFKFSCWAYPIFNKLPWWGTILFVLATGVAMLIYQYIGIKLSDYAWPKKRIDYFFRSHSETYNLSRRHIITT